MLTESIKVTKELKEYLDLIGHKSETYDGVIKRIICLYHNNPDFKHNLKVAKKQKMSKRELKETMEYLKCKTKN